MVNGRMHRMTTRGKRMSPYFENHSGDPKYYGRNAIQHASLEECLERSPQDLEQVGKVEPGKPVPGNK